MSAFTIDLHGANNFDYETQPLLTETRSGGRIWCNMRDETREKCCQVYILACVIGCVVSYRVVLKATTAGCGADETTLDPSLYASLNACWKNSSPFRGGVLALITSIVLGLIGWRWRKSE